VLLGQGYRAPRGAVISMEQWYMIGSGTRNTEGLGGKPAAAPLRLNESQLKTPGIESWVSVVRSQRLAACSLARLWHGPWGIVYREED
jgi:hypothetical protein